MQQPMLQTQRGECYASSVKNLRFQRWENKRQLEKHTT